MIGEQQGKNRRRFPRYPMAVPVQLRWENRGRLLSDEGTTIDISRGGVCLVTRGRLAQGFALALTLDFRKQQNRQQELLRTYGKIVRVEGDSRTDAFCTVAVAFEVQGVA